MFKNNILIRKEIIFYLNSTIIKFLEKGLICHYVISNGVFTINL